MNIVPEKNQDIFHPVNDKLPPELKSTIADKRHTSTLVSAGHVRRHLQDERLMMANALQPCLGYSSQREALMGTETFRKQVLVM